nr:MAG TPA_asm: hypothetical protein [Caudoviricetes sp.]
MGALFFCNLKEPLAVFGQENAVASNAARFRQSLHPTLISQ